MNRRCFLKVAGAGMAAGILPGSLPSFARASQGPPRPNVVLIMVDDMGWSDLSCFGSEIPTPNVDRLAAGGVRFTHFYNNAKCSPTRASLLTGQFPPACGMGGSVPRPLSRCVMIPHVLKSAGYDSYHVGKWHLRGHPIDWGFDHSWGLLSGADNYFEPEKRWTDGRKETEDPDFGPGFYTTEAFTEHALACLDEADREENPFFLYLAYTAPHWPLQAWPEDIARYRGKYREGWDVLRQRRFERQKELGVMPPHAELSPRDGRVPPWDGVSEKEKDLWDNHMAVYAAMMDCMDRGVGRVMAKLRQMGVAEDTLVMFTGDNGTHATIRTDTAWGEYKGGKGRSDDSGVHVPLIAQWPAALPAGKVSDIIIDFSDFVPTLADLCGGKLPQDRVIDGVSFADLLKGESFEGREWSYCFEHPKPHNTRRKPSPPGWFARTKKYKLYHDGKFVALAPETLAETRLDTGEMTPQQKAARDRLQKVIDQFPNRLVALDDRG